MHHHSSNTAENSTTTTTTTTAAAETAAACTLPIPAPTASNPSIRRCSSAAALTTAPVYPSPLVDIRHPAIIRLQQKPVPYVRELVPGKENPAMASTSSPSANTSRELEIVVEESTGRIRTNRTSMDPWSFYASTLDEKPLPSLRGEGVSRYWIFRDEQGIVSGPLLFLLGHLFPVLWWIGSVYPKREHPDNVVDLEQGTTTAEDGAAELKDPMNQSVIESLQQRLKAAGATISSMVTGSEKPRDPSTPLTPLEIVRISEDTHREGSMLSHINGNNNTSAIHVPSPSPIHTAPQPVDTHGPWSAENHAASLFERRMEHDRKVFRYELDQRWKRINLIWSVGSFVLAIAITAFIFGFA